MADIKFDREMGFKESEFLRIFPIAINGAKHEIEGRTIRVEMNPGELLVELGAQQYRKIASISLPYLKVSFSFNGIDELRVKEFITYFDLRYQRGGG